MPDNLTTINDAPIWIIDDDRAIRFVLEHALGDAGFTPRSFSSAAPALAAIESGEIPMLVYTDIRMPGMDGLSWLKRARTLLPTLSVVVMSAYTDLSSTVAAFDGGALDYLPKPFDLMHAVGFAQRAQNQRNISKLLPTPAFVSQSAVMAEVFRAIGRVARTELSVLITGETGTGKELIARALHQHSNRAKQPFVALNTAAIAPELLESELFGHEQGAFTGAHRRHAGRFEQAEGGTLFLDEIGDMPLALQTRLLRVLAEGEYFLLGGRDLKRTNVRLLAATHQDLQGKVARGEFRADLLHRLNVVEIRMPPLRERGADLARLCDELLDASACELKTSRKRLSDKVLQRFANYGWPGNVRELRNYCLRLTALAPGPDILEEDVISFLPQLNQQRIEATQTGDMWASLQAFAAQELAVGKQNLSNDWHAQLDHCLIQAALTLTGNDRQKAAKRLGVGRNTLTRKLGPKS